MRAHNKSLDEMTSQQREVIAAIRAQRKTPEAIAEREKLREEIRQEFPPAQADGPLLAILSSLRVERERQGLSLADVAERSQMDKATLSKLETGKVANPTYLTIRTYAKALGKQIEWRLEDRSPQIDNPISSTSRTSPSRNGTSSTS